MPRFVIKAESPNAVCTAHAPDDNSRPSPRQNRTQNNAPPYRAQTRRKDRFTTSSMIREDKDLFVRQLYARLGPRSSTAAGWSGWLPTASKHRTTDWLPTYASMA